MYMVAPNVWVRVATMYFEGPATKWLQSVHHRIRSASWNELYSWIHDMFGRDQHKFLIRQLFHIKQFGSVQEYIDQFSELIDQLIAYDHYASDNHYYTARFVDGLKDDIKSVVLVQRPCNLDTACCLSLLQEEADTARFHELKKVDYSFRPKSSVSAKPLPLPPPPAAIAKTYSGSAAIANPATKSASDAQAASKVVALTAYRMARGLYRYCAEKWVKGHKCAATVPLHAIQEIWEMLSTNSESDSK
jgi:hypothetical protein